MSSVTCFLDFDEDRRTSMEVYAQNLLFNLNLQKSSELTFSAFRPALRAMTAALPSSLNLRMRVARYVDYPLQAGRHQGDVNHILDHGYAHLLGVLDPSRTVVTVHDIIPILAGKGLMPGVKLNGRSWLSEWSSRYLKKAKRIIAISENTKKDLVECCSCNPDRITVIYYGLSPYFDQRKSTSKERSREQLGLPSLPKKLVLITGQQFYKNQSTSLKVMEQLQLIYKNDIKLVRLGRQTPEWQESCGKSRFKEQVIEMEYLSNENMPLLYSAVDCLLFPSWYEGFGWPPVESMACGTPVVTSNAASLPEAVGDAGLKFSPNDFSGMAHAVGRVFEDETFRNKHIEMGLEHVKRFNWQNNAAKVLKIYEELSQQ